MTRRTMTTCLTALAATGFMASVAQAQTFNDAAPNGAAFDQVPAVEGQTRAPVLDSGAELQQQVLAEGLEHPWGLVGMPDGNWLVTERPGRMRIITADGQISDPIAGIPEVDARDQGGLHDVSVADDFAETRRVWWTYAEPRGDGTNGTAVATGVLSADGTAMEDVSRIWQQQPAWASTKHFGARIVHDGDGNIFVGLGERSDPEPRVFAQDLQSTIGKIIRIDAMDGSPQGANIEGALPEIWSVGHRNIQGAAMGPDGQLWMNEHGPRGGDELNLIEGAQNHGWPAQTYGIDYDRSQMGATVVENTVQPVYYWDPSPAISGMAFYDGDMFPDWQGQALIGALGTEEIIRISIDGARVTGEARHAQGIGRVRDIEVAGDGAIMVITDEDNGQLIRLSNGG